jgi:hypothetical protein
MANGNLHKDLYFLEKVTQKTQNLWKRLLIPALRRRLARGVILHLLMALNQASVSAKR